MPSQISNSRETRPPIRLETIVQLSPDEVMDLWLDPSGIARFLAPRAVVDPRVGGQYTIMFDPENDPHGDSQGTRGARILRIDRPHRLSFEWTMPPFAASLNTQPLPTWVEVSFTPARDRQADATHVMLEHHGFGAGPEWERAYEWFRDAAWPSVMRRLETIRAVRHE